MAKTNSIEPFPADINRDHFGHWLSGFTDGEAHFHLSLRGKRHTEFKTPWIYFGISLRQDDLPILRTIQSFFGFGRIHLIEKPSKTKKTNPIAIFTVSKHADLEKLVLHFDAYPLRAKKLADFLVWKKAVALLAVVKGIRMKGHTASRWTPERLGLFKHFAKEIKEQRSFFYNPLATVVQMTAKKAELNLFDNIS